MVEVARRGLAWEDGEQRGPLRAAPGPGRRAAGVEVAAGRRAQRRRDLARDGAESASALPELRHAVEQRARVGVRGGGVEPRDWRRFHDPAQVHDRHPLRDVSHHAEVVGDEQPGQRTAGAKARVIADALRPHRMDAAWMLRSFVDYNPRRRVSAGTGQCKGLIDQPRTNGRWFDPCQAQQRRSVADRACGFRRSLDQLWPCGVRLSSLTQRPEQQREGGCRP